MDGNLLNDRIGRLKEWTNTESLNEILFKTLSSLNDYTNESFAKLTQEIREESALNEKPPVIKTAVNAGDDADKQLFLYPVSTAPPINNSGYITTVFAECDYGTIQELINHTFTAEIRGKTGTCRSHVNLRYSQKYLQKLEYLYYTFSANELPWSTVNGTYFYKFLDVICKKDLEHEIGEIESFDINFSQFEGFISYDKTLLWNVKQISAPVVTCEARPAYDAIQYEHELKDLQFDQNQYLVCPTGERFSSFRQGQRMYVRTYTSQLTQVELLRIGFSDEANSQFYLPVKSNKKKEGFINSLARGSYIPTRSEAERIVNAISELAQLLLLDVKIIPYTDENVKRYTGLNYNSFIERKAFLSNKSLLLFSFKTSENKLWAHELMYFALSELQLYFYEYCCVGELL